MQTSLGRALVFLPALVRTRADNVIDKDYGDIFSGQYAQLIDLLIPFAVVARGTIIVHVMSSPGFRGSEEIPSAVWKYWRFVMNFLILS